MNVIFNDSENPTLAKHFVFAFETANLSNLLNFQLSLLDNKTKPINFAANEKKKKKKTALTFSIQVIKQDVKS